MFIFWTFSMVATASIAAVIPGLPTDGTAVIQSRNNAPVQMNFFDTIAKGMKRVKTLNPHQTPAVGPPPYSMPKSSAKFDTLRAVTMKVAKAKGSVVDAAMNLQSYEVRLDCIQKPGSVTRKGAFVGKAFLYSPAEEWKGPWLANQGMGFAFDQPLDWDFVIKNEWTPDKVLVEGLLALKTTYPNLVIDFDRYGIMELRYGAHSYIADGEPLSTGRIVTVELTGLLLALPTLTWRFDLETKEVMMDDDMRATLIPPEIQT